jgi:hypothetical protein
LLAGSNFFIMKKLLFLLVPVLLSLACQKDNKTSMPPVFTKSNTTAPLASATTLSFSGYTWNIKDSGAGTAGPGPNRWSTANAFVDAQGYLHLKVTKVGTKWYCAEVTSTQSFGYGTYQWYVEGRIDQLDKNVVLGLFNYSGADGYDEMDIEYAKWGISGANNTNFTVYPAQGSSLANWHTTFNTTLTGTYTTQRFKRNNNASVYFQELGGFQSGNTNQITSATCNNPPNSISTLGMPVHMNLWLFQGHAPANNAPVEIIVHNFTFTHL